MARAYVPLYFSYAEQLAMLSDDERGRLILQLLEYAQAGTVPKLEPTSATAMWHMVLTMEIEEKDYLQVFKLTKIPTGQHIVHEQEQPPYRYELDVPCDDAVDAKVFVIDDLTHSTMLLAEEY